MIHNTIIQGDALGVAQTLPDECLHMICTSPPYWGLRDYGLPPTDWLAVEYSPMAGLPPLSIEPWRGCLGLEPTPEMFVGHIVAVFRELRRALRGDGTLFLNFGDSYIGYKGTNYGTNPENSNLQKNSKILTAHEIGTPQRSNLKPKDLCGIPWRVALALQADGWYLRSDIIWFKKNPMPESVTDRPTKAHEYLFLLSKSARYFYDTEAVKEETIYKNDPRAGRGHINYDGKRDGTNGQGQRAFVSINPEGRNRRSVWDIATESYPEAHFACVDAETECLTIEGWKKYDEINRGDIAAQFDIETGLLSWGEIEQVAVYQVENQDMVIAQNHSCQMVLTPNHRTIISRRHPQTRKQQPLTVIQAEELKPSHSIPVSADWEYLPGIEQLESTTGDWAELVGWYIAEGCETIHSWTVEIYQSHSANPEKVERIRHLLDEVGAEYTEASATRQWQNKTVNNVAFQIRGFAATYLRELAPNKQLPANILQWHHRLLKRLLDGLVDGDGHRRKDGRFSYIQRSKNNADLVQAIGTRLGYATMVSWRSNGSYIIYFTRKRLLSFRGTAGEGAQIEQRKYTGVVWCPKLPKGTWVARKNGRMFITGNTFPRKLVEPCILAGTSARGCCPACGTPWARVVEKSVSLESGSGKSGQVPNGKYSNTEQATSGAYDIRMGPVVRSITTGWQPTCTCPPAEPVPAVVYDPFMGSGTVAEVAARHRRHYLGSELNPDYIELAQRRINGTEVRLF